MKHWFWILAVCTLVDTHTAAAASAAAKCEANKNKLAGNYYACREKAEARSITKGTPADYAKCSAKFEGKWDGAEAKGEGTCPDTVTAAGIDSYLSQQQLAVAAILAGGDLPSCGDGTMNVVGEQCDGSDLAGESCAGLGFLQGSLACSGCELDTSGCSFCPTCATCGNGTAEIYEDCDGADLRSRTCKTQGFAYGALSCAGGCFLDTSGCTNTRFIDNGDGTVSDNETGLQWEKKAGRGGVHDAYQTYDFARLCTVATAKRCQPTAAASAACFAGVEGNSGGCDECGAGEGTCGSGAAIETTWTWLGELNATNFAGHNDWRIPRARELLTLLAYEEQLGTQHVSINAAFNGANCGETCTDVTDPACSCTISLAPYGYMTATTGPGSGSHVFVDFTNNRLQSNQISARNVRAVRGGS